MATNKHATIRYHALDRCFGNYGDEDTNKTRWTSKMTNGDWIIGVVTRIADNRWSTFLPENTKATINIPQKRVRDNKLNDEDTIKVITEPSPDGTITFINAISK